MALNRELKKISNKLQAFFDLKSFANPENPTIALNMITKNNENVIKVALESCHDVVDEMVIVDTGSTDKTKEIIRSYPNAKLIEDKDFKGYSYHRNQAIAMTDSDWILVIDSDEYLSQHLRANIRELIKTKYYGLFRMYSRWINKVYEKEYDPSELFCSARCGATFVAPTKKYKGRYNLRNRIFRNMPEIEFRGEVHESIFGHETMRVKDLERDFAVYHLDVAINSLEQRLEKTLKRNELKPGTAYPEEYIPELYDFKYLDVQGEDLKVLEHLKILCNSNI
ncbi:MAG: glycosyltransferase family 2 protein [Candidatus Caenarcaniphilales bacterium]|nr:glycosyltransferase family 2 protein [Candidatus Caenarcaniphilales bacterium]